MSAGRSTREWLLLFGTRCWGRDAAADRSGSAICTTLEVTLTAAASCATLALQRRIGGPPKARFTRIPLHRLSA